MAGLQAGVETRTLQRRRSALRSRRENLASRHRPVQQVRKRRVAGPILRNFSGCTISKVHV